MGGMQQPPQFNWRCVTLNKWCKNKHWLEAWGRGPGDAACFIGQELCTAPGWNWAMHCWDTLQPPNHQASQRLLWRKRQRHSFHSAEKHLIGAEEKVWMNLVTRYFLLQQGAYHRPHLQFQFLHAGKQIHNCKISSKRCLPHLLLDLMYVILCFEETAANSLQPIPFPCVIHTWPPS